MEEPKEVGAGDPLDQLMEVDLTYEESERRDQGESPPAGSPTLNSSTNIKATAFGALPSNVYSEARDDVDNLETGQSRAWQDVLEDRWITEGDESRHQLENPGTGNTVDVTDIGIPTSPRRLNLDLTESTADQREDVLSTTKVLPPRPPLRKTQLEPPSQDPPPPPSQQQQQSMNENAPDSLSLLQLKRLVSDMPGREPAAYSFVYDDTASFPDEIDEWFSYSVSEKEMKGQVKATFEESWSKSGKTKSTRSSSSKPKPWLDASPSEKAHLVEASIQELESVNVATRIRGLETLNYIALGVWGETAGLQVDDMFKLSGYGHPDGIYKSSTLQMKSMIDGAGLIYEAIGIPSIYTLFRGACTKVMAKSNSEFDFDAIDIVEDRDIILASLELNHSMTLMYVLIEAGRRQVAVEHSVKLRDDIACLEPDLLDFLVKTLAKMRWKETAMLPTTKLLLLFWKSLLLLFGSTDELNDTKKALTNKKDQVHGQINGNMITASPLDYHLFRQEITSKYPAYNPPQPLLPFELENNSILPPLHTVQNRAPGSHGPLSGIGPSNFSNPGGSIIHQPVHIATPAPSPPPSPAGPGGKAGKKQNYQTNQNFPFLYPPSGTSSSSVVGQGSSNAHKSLVGKPWEGSDVPESILEAGELFSKRTRMTRATRQLWDERERFVKFERGWENSKKSRTGSQNSPDDAQERSSSRNQLAGERAETANLAPDVHRRLNTVDQFYRHSISKLQSLVIVLLKEVLANVTISITQPNPWNGNGNGLGPGFQEGGMDGNPSKRRQQEAFPPSNDLGSNPANVRDDDFSADLDTLDTIRTREINAKAVSGILIVLLKWFKVSHVLRYEYLAQLLLDSNYLPLVLKLFAHQEIDKVVESKTDSPSQSFFAYCQLHSEHAAGELQDSGQDSSNDEAAPPPIRLRRNQSTAQLSSGVSRSSIPSRPGPEVDEFGQPTGDLPSTPRSSFSWRNFFSSITSLRIMQKLTRHKTHRNLLLVHYKSSTILRKLLKVPQPELRLYTLKLFKGQVPYCGRKWRQSNMRVITAVYLHVSPELRDDWLAGGDVDAEVEEALPLEQALRALTHWWHCIEYPEQMGTEESLLESEMDFFTRELDSMDWGLDDGAEEMGRDEWEGPFRVEGW